MIFNLEEVGQGEWFPFFESRINDQGEVEYDDPKEGAGRVCIRSVVPFFRSRGAGRKRKFEFVLNPKSRAMERVGYYDELDPEQDQKERDDAWDYAITAWEGLFDSKGTAIPCTRENKAKLMLLPVFDRFVAKCQRLLDNAGVQNKEEVEKN